MTFNIKKNRLSGLTRMIAGGSMPILAAICLSGCASLVFPKSASPRYTLAPVPVTDFQSHTIAAATREAPETELGETFGQKKKFSPVRLIVEDPAIEAALNTTGIAISDAPLSYKYLKGAKWSDRAPRLFGLFLRRSFQNSSFFSVIGDRQTIPVGDYILYADLRSFHVEERQNRLVADVTLHIHVTKTDNTALGSTLISVQKDISRSAGNDIIMTFDTVVREVGLKAINWTYETINAAELQNTEAQALSRSPTENADSERTVPEKTAPEKKTE